MCSLTRKYTFLCCCKKLRNPSEALNQLISPTSSVCEAVNFSMMCRIVCCFITSRYVFNRLKRDGISEDRNLNIYSDEVAWMGDGDDMGTCGCRPAAVRSRMGGGPLDLKDTRGRTLCSTLAREVTVRRRDTPSAATTATATTPFLSVNQPH